MKKWHPKFQKSQNLLECLLALGLFFMFIISFATLAARYTNSIARSQDINAIKYSAIENFEALQNIAYENFSALATGSYDLNPENNSWQLSAATADYNCLYQCKPGQGQGKAIGFYKCKDQDKNRNKDCNIILQYQKTVNIQAAMRNSQCELDPNGTEDLDTKFVVITFNWLQNGQINTNSFSQYFTNWKNPAACSAAPYGQAANLAFDNTKTTRQDGYPWIYPLTTINHAIIKNTGTSAIKIDKVQISWSPESTYPPTQLYDFSIDGTTYWYWWGYKPNAMQLSGATLDIANYTLTPKKQKEIKFRVVNVPNELVNFSINFIMEDGSQIKSDMSPYPPISY